MDDPAGMDVGQHPCQIADHPGRLALRERVLTAAALERLPREPLQNEIRQTVGPPRGGTKLPHRDHAHDVGMIERREDLPFTPRPSPRGRRDRLRPEEHFDRDRLRAGHLTGPVDDRRPALPHRHEVG